LVCHEVVAPDVVRIQRAIDFDRALPLMTPFPLLTRYLQALSLPDQPQTISTDVETFSTQDRVDLPVAIPR
jgi:hypothetical protein